MIMACIKKNIFMLFVISTIFISSSCVLEAGEFARVVISELEQRGFGQDLVKVADKRTNITVFYDPGAYDAVFRKRGDEAFSTWFNSLSFNGVDKNDIVAVILTNQRVDGVSSPKLLGHKFGFMETEGVVLMTPSCMFVFDNPWGTIGQYMGKSDRVEYANANIGDNGNTFIVGKRRYKNSAFTSLLVELKRLANKQ